MYFYIKSDNRKSNCQEPAQLKVQSKIIIKNKIHMEQKTNPIDTFYKEAPEVSKAFNNLVEALKNTKGLDTKTKQLVYIGIKAALGDTTAVYYHVPMAKKAGATREEIKDTILITLTVCGLKGVTTSLPVALEIYDKIV
jgi:alkylhydroperoxidase/carboxymuconolactone decarboxylase family protein YurZ